MKLFKFLFPKISVRYFEFEEAEAKRNGVKCEHSHWKPVYARLAGKHMKRIGFECRMCSYRTFAVS